MCPVVGPRAADKAIKTANSILARLVSPLLCGQNAFSLWENTVNAYTLKGIASVRYLFATKLSLFFSHQCLLYTGLKPQLI